MNDADDARLTRLEERQTHLERHITEQDKVILAQTEAIDRLRRELVALREQFEASGVSGGVSPPIDERPPHY